MDGDSSSDSSSTSDGDSDSDSSSEEDSEDGGPPEAVSAKVEVPSMFEVDGGGGKDEEGGPAPAGKPTIHPSRLRPEGQDHAMDDEDKAGETKKIQVVCKHWRAGECGLGDSCPYLHSVRALPFIRASPADLIPSQIPANTAPRLPPKRKRPAPPPAPHNPFARTTDPWAQLEERDWRHVVSDVLQVVNFLTKNDFLKGVERRVGEIEEEGGIEDLGEVPEMQSEGGELKGGKGIEEMSEVSEVALAEKAVDDGPAQAPSDERAAAEEDLILGADTEDDSFGQDDTIIEDAEANEQADDEFLEPPSDDEEGADQPADVEAGDALLAYLGDDGEIEVERAEEGEGSAEITVEETGETIAV